MKEGGKEEGKEGRKEGRKTKMCTFPNEDIDMFCWYEEWRWEDWYL
jgi:hypothetical protein